MNTNAMRSPCIDAETLAAWADDGLSAHEAAQVELHLSTCERCQQVLAAFSRSEPAAAVVIPFWSRRPVRWGAGALAAAAAVTLVVWTGPPEVVPTQETTMARNESGAAASPEFRPNAPAAAADERVDDLKKTTAPDAASQTAGRQSAATPRSRPAAEEAARQTVLPPPTVSAAPPAAGVMPPPPPAAQGPPARGIPPPPASPPPPTEPPTGPPAGVVGGVTAGRAVVAEPELELRDMAEKAPSDLPVVEIVVPDTPTFPARRFDAGRAGARAAGGGRGGGEREGSLVPVRWRILQGTRVERSVDNGATWSPATLVPRPGPLRDRQALALEQQSFVLTAGAAASPTVCWLAGRDGVVFLSRDGVTFQQVTSPSPMSIASIEAVDADQAAITTVDGRTFATTDAGVTWRERR